MNVPASKLHESAPSWNTTCKVVRTTLEHLDFGVCKVVLLKICDLLEKLQTAFYYRVSFADRDEVKSATVVEKQCRQGFACAIFRLDAIKYEPHQRLVKDVSTNVNDVGIDWVLDRHARRWRIETGGHRLAL